MSLENHKTQKSICCILTLTSSIVVKSIFSFLLKFVLNVLQIRLLITIANTLVIFNLIQLIHKFYLLKFFLFIEMKKVVSFGKEVSSRYRVPEISRRRGVHKVQREIFWKRYNAKKRAVPYNGPCTGISFSSRFKFWSCNCRLITQMPKADFCFVMP